MNLGGHHLRACATIRRIRFTDPTLADTLQQQMNAALNEYFIDRIPEDRLRTLLCCIVDGDYQQLRGFAEEVETLPSAVSTIEHQNDRLLKEAGRH